MNHKDTMSSLRSQYAVLAVLVVALIAQMPHAQHVFYLRGHDNGWASWLQSWGFAIALEVAVLVFVVRGNVRASWGFATFSVAINLVYYAQATKGAWYMSVPDWLLSVGLPLAIALYSHELSEVHATTTAAQGEREVATTSTLAQPEENAEEVAGASLQQLDAELVQDALPVPTPTWAAAVVSTQANDAQLDDKAQRILDAIRDGARTPYAIAQRTEIPLTTLRRKDGDKYIGRLPRMVAAGQLRNGGDEYKLAE